MNENLGACLSKSKNKKSKKVVIKRQNSMRGGPVPFGFDYLEGKLVQDPKELLIAMKMTLKGKDMNIDGLIKLSLSLAAVASLTGQVPNVVKEIRVAQLKILKESQASKWERPFILGR